jgi:hypothetical protein
MIAATGNINRQLRRKKSQAVAVTANQLAACEEGMLPLPPFPPRMFTSTMW